MKNEILLVVAVGFLIFWWQNKAATHQNPPQVGSPKRPTKPRSGYSHLNKVA
jgi:hypothetical protein